jgi:hypothetical protein
MSNKWDRDVAIKRAMGVPAVVFEQTATVLKIR